MLEREQKCQLFLFTPHHSLIRYASRAHQGREGLAGTGCASGTVMVSLPPIIWNSLPRIDSRVVCLSFVNCTMQVGQQTFAPAVSSGAQQFSQ
jgi:hypothetical protein